MKYDPVIRSVITSVAYRMHRDNLRNKDAITIRVVGIFTIIFCILKIQQQQEKQKEKLFENPELFLVIDGVLFGVSSFASAARFEMVLTFSSMFGELEDLKSTNSDLKSFISMTKSDSVLQLSFCDSC